MLNAALIGVLGAIWFVVMYRWYGNVIDRQIIRPSDAQATPANTLRDNIDYVPTHPAILFGHHFSSIAGAGPIVGPIIAAVAFGWAVPLVWVLLGSIFIGGAHDFSALVASVRNRGRSIADIARESMSPLAYRRLDRVDAAEQLRSADSVLMFTVKGDYQGYTIVSNTGLQRRTVKYSDPAVARTRDGGFSRFFISVIAGYER